MKELLSQPTAAMRIKAMTRGVRERFALLDPKIFISRDLMFHAMTSSLPAWVDPPDERELSACLVQLVKDGAFQKVKGPSSPSGKWSEPAYQVVVPQESEKSVKASPKGQSPYSYGSHKCERCGDVIRGKGRHGKSSRGHGKTECDASMVAAMMKD